MSDKSFKALQREIKKYVKQGYRVDSQTEYSASLSKLSMSKGASITRFGEMLQGKGRKYAPDRQDTLYIQVDENGKVDVTKGKGKI